MIEAILSTVSSWITGLISSAGYPGIIFLMLSESAGIPAPSEIIMPFSGFLIYSGQFNFWSVALAGTVGNLFGSIVAYWLGYVGGRPFIQKYGQYILLSEHDLALSEKFFAKRGNLTVFVGRLLPVIRTYISFPAGIAKMNFWWFCVYTVLGAFPWCVMLTYVGVRLGEHWAKIKEYTRGLDLLIVIVLALGILWWSRRHSLEKSKYQISKHFRI